MKSQQRNLGLIRLWNLLVAIRRRGRTLNELAALFHVSTRTIRRDLECLQEVGVPLVQRKDDEDVTRWRVERFGAWPPRSNTPVKELVYVPHNKHRASV